MTRWRRWIPIAISILCLGWLLASVRPAPLARALAGAALAPFLLLWLCVGLVSFVLACAAYALALGRPSLDFADVVRARAAGYPLGVLHEAAAHAATAVLLTRRHAVPAGAAAAAATTVAACYGLGLVTVAVPGLALGLVAHAPWMLAAAAIGWAAAAWRRCLRVAALQTVHVAIQLFATWAALGTFGADVPLAQAAVRLPLVSLVRALPLAPGGAGTTEVAAVALLAPFAAGPAVLAAYLAMRAVNALVRVGLGLAFTSAPPRSR